MKKTAIVTIACAVALALGICAFRDGASPRAATLDQGWTPEQAAFYHYSTQGTVMMPTAWLRALRRPDGTPIMAPANLQRLGFMDVHARVTPTNPHGFPIGLAVDRVNGVETTGATCALCHTSELTFRGSVIRIEGGSPNSLDLGTFFKQLTAAVEEVKANARARERFTHDALAYGYPQDRLKADFDRESANPELWLLNTAGMGGESTFPGPGRIDALTGIGNRLFAYDLHDPKAAVRGIAPTRFPYMWDIWRLDWVQYNGSVRQPMARNVGEALGVGVVTNILDAQNKLSPEPERWRSSIHIQNLYQIEQTLATLQPPVFPQSIFGKVDATQAQRGRALFAQRCAQCHGVSRIEGTTPAEWAVRVIPYQTIGTDKYQAAAFAAGRVSLNAVGINKTIPAALGVGYMVSHIKGAAYAANGISGEKAARYDGWGRTGESTAPCGYKARPLVGVWATPPFLHNGSVPTVFDLLSEKRPSRPIQGNREYDPVKLGTAQVATASTMVLDTSLVGNGNAGHWFTNDASRPGRIGAAMSDAQKYDIIAYLKIATYADYPAASVAKPYPLPCDRDFDWANGQVPDVHLPAR
jgi:cytochrome c5